MKKMNRAIEYPIYPTAEQASLIRRTFGCVRYIWNQMLADHNEFKAATDIDFTPTPAKYKKDAPFLKEVDSLALANTQLALNKAFSKFYNENNVGYPNFKSKKRDRKSYTTNNQVPKGGCPTIYIGDGFIHLPKVGNIPANLYRLPQSDWRLKNATVKQTKTGRYFCVLTFEFEIDIQEVQPSVERGIGLDYSSPLFYVDSEGRSPEFPKPFRTAEAKLANEQHKLSRMKRGSKNYNKQLLKVQKLHEHIANQRKDFLHKLSREIANSYDNVCAEDINLRGIASGLRLGKSTNDNGFGMFRNFLEYKLGEQGKLLIRIDRFYPSSKMCSVCGYIKDDLTLEDRIYVCPSCGSVVDRDKNAAINILVEGVESCYAALPKAG